MYERPILGEGEHTYECHHDWLTPPAAISWGDTHGLAVDRDGYIYVAHTVHANSESSDSILVFDPSGRFVRSWGEQFRGGAHGLGLREENGQEFLYLCDVLRRKVTKLSLAGEPVWEKGVPTESGVYPSEDKWCPTNVAFHPDGDLYVADGYGSSYVHRYSAGGDYKGIVIGPGTEAGFVMEPHGLCVDVRPQSGAEGGSEARLVVADRGNKRLQEFTLSGEHIGFIYQGMRLPCHIQYQGSLAVVPDLDSVVTILGPGNEPVASLGDGSPSKLRDGPREEFIPGKFIHPHAAIWINSRDILVAEWVPIGRLTLLLKI